MNEILAITKELIGKLGVEASSIDLVDIAGTTFIAVTTPSDGFSGYGGDRVKALNTLVRLVTDKKGIDVRFTIDVNGFYKAEVEKLTGTAKMLAERARSLKYDVELEPMRPFDRMVVHAALTNEKDVKTESVGMGRDRKVVIKYVGQ